MNRVVVGSCLLVIGLTGQMAAVANPLAPFHDRGGLAIGNGAQFFPSRAGKQQITLADFFEELEEDFFDGKVSEIRAPKSENSQPPTRLLIQVYRIALSAEDALQKLVAGSEDWIGFTLGKFSGIYREREVAPRSNRLEMQLFRSADRLVLNLEGNKEQSPSYNNLAAWLKEEITCSGTCEEGKDEQEE